MRSIEGRTAADARRLRIASLALRRTAELLLALPVVAIADSARFDILAQPLPGALKIFAEQAHMQLLYDYRVVEHAKGNAIVGVLEKHSALEQLLRNTNLEAVYSSDAAATIRPVSGAATPADAATEVEPAAASESEKILPQSPRQETREHPVSTTDNYQGNNVMPRKSPFARFGAFVGSIVSVLFTAHAHGQETNGEISGLEEIIVTAEHRTGDVQRVATSISVRTGEELQEQGKYDLRQILENVPGVAGGAWSGGGVIGRPGGNGNNDNPGAGIIIRGIASNAGAAGDLTAVAPATALYTDGVYGGLGGNYDLEQVEILRGPQGTLYGRSAVAGVVSAQTVRPKLGEFGGYVMGEVGDYALRHAEGAVNVPIGELTALRLSGTNYQRDGYYDDVGGKTRTRSGRAKLLYQPSDDLTILIGGVYQKTQSRSGGISFTQASPTSPIVYEPDPTGDSHSKQWQVWGQVDWRLPWATLTSITALRSFEQTSLGYGRSGQQLMSNPTSTPRDRFLTQEVRLASPTDGRLTWQAGLFHYRNEVELSQAGMFVSSGSLGSKRHTEKTTRQTGIFTEATYHFADTLRLNAGVRYDNTIVQRDEIYTLNVNLCCGGPTNSSTYGLPEILVANVLGGSAGRREWDNVTYKLRLESDVGPRSLVYASVSTGFTPGDVAMSVANGVPVVLEIDSETVTSYELGTKNRFWDERLQINGDVYYSEFGGVQLSGINIGSSANPNFVTLTAPLRSYGLEAETLLQATDADRFGLSLAVQEAVFHNRSNLFLSNVSREHMYGFSPVQATLFYDRLFDLRGGSNLTFHAEAVYNSARDVAQISSVRLGQGYLSYVRQEAYVLGNISATWKAASGAFSVTGYVRNISDERYKIAGLVNDPVAPSTIATGLYNFGEPRRVGVMLKVNF